MPRKIEEVTQDLEELRQLLSKAQRPYVQAQLGLEIRKLESEISLQKSEAGTSQTTTIPSKVVPKPVSTTKCYDVKLSTYAWDQSDKFVKFYITLNEVQTLPSENVTCSFTSKSMELKVQGLAGKNYILPITNLLEPIDPSKSHHKVKSDMVTVFLAKVTPNKWSHVTVEEYKAAEARKPKLDEGADPSQSLMNMMKQMYDDGDAEMKRTIAKAMIESREKQAKGHGGFDDL